MKCVKGCYERENEKRINLRDLKMSLPSESVCIGKDLKMSLPRGNACIGRQRPEEFERAKTQETQGMSRA